MFIGHYGVGFAAKKVGRRISLGTLFMASQFIDLLWPAFILLGWEQVRIDPGNTAFTPLDFVYYPFSHSLFGVLVWAILFGLVYYVIRKNTRNAVIVGALVLSHWVLDFLVHRADLPLVPWSDFKVGLGLWNSVVISIVLESLIFAGGAILYLKATLADNKKGRYGLWGLIIFLAVVYIMNVFGPPPDAAKPVAIVGLAQWLIVAWAYWVDHNRTAL